MAKRTKQTAGVIRLKPIKVNSAAENWSEYQLEDGTLLKARPLIMEIERHEEQYGPLGEPVYQIKAGVIFDIKPKMKSKKKP